MKNSIKIWPFLEGISSGINPYNAYYINFKNAVYIDFSNVQKAKSSGSAFVLFKLLTIIRENKHTVYNIELPENNEISTFLYDCGLFSIIDNNILNRGIFYPIEGNKTPCTSLREMPNGNSITSRPIFHFKFKDFEYRECVENFIDILTVDLLFLKKKYKFRLNLLLKLIKEIAKNSEDHADSEALFGIDVIENNTANTCKIEFSFCDFGIGIHKKIKKFVDLDPRYRPDASSKFGMVDSYQHAYTPGFTTSKISSNKGIGMPMILDCVKTLKLNLMIFDARSMGFIPETNTHEEIRRNFWDTGNKVGFYYFGEMDLIKTT